MVSSADRHLADDKKIDVSALEEMLAAMLSTQPQR
jgi:hypothetical protein